MTVLMSGRVWRRKYLMQGRCMDCGWERRTTWITWWVSGFRYRVCAVCIRAYRDRILKGVD